jgi:hypothetical protein
MWVSAAQHGFSHAHAVKRIEHHSCRQFYLTSPSFKHHVCTTHIHHPLIHHAPSFTHHVLTHAPRTHHACITHAPGILVCTPRTLIHAPPTCTTHMQTPSELAGFLQNAVALHRAHLLLCQRVDPVPPSTPRNLARRSELLEGHKRCARL